MPSPTSPEVRCKEVMTVFRMIWNGHSLSKASIVRQSVRARSGPQYQSTNQSPSICRRCIDLAIPVQSNVNPASNGIQFGEFIWPRTKPQSGCNDHPSRHPVLHWFVPKDSSTGLRAKLAPTQSTCEDLQLLVGDSLLLSVLLRWHCCEAIGTTRALSRGDCESNNQPESPPLG